MQHSLDCGAVVLKSAGVQTGLANGETEELVEMSLVLQRSLLAWMAGQLGPGNVSLTQFMVLSMLAKQGDATMSRLASQMQHTTAATTGLVDRLVEGGMVTRNEDADDRRRVIVKITPEGREIVGRIQTKMSENIMNVCELLGPEDSQAWVRIYRRLLAVCSTLAPV